MHSDSKTTTLTASGEVFSGPSRIVGVYYVASAAAGSIVLKDGGASGTTIADIATPGGASNCTYIDLSNAPLRCTTSTYATISNVTSCMVVYN